MHYEGAITRKRGYMFQKSSIAYHYNRLPIVCVSASLPLLLTFSIPELPLYLSECPITQFGQDVEYRKPS